jgi:hypothetical protein
MPKGTPKEIIAKLNAAIVDALADANVRKRLTDLGQEIPPREDQNPQTLYAYHKAEIEKWWPILKAANIRASDLAAGHFHDLPFDESRAANVGLGALRPLLCST